MKSFFMVDRIGDFVLETNCYSKDFKPQIGAEVGAVASTDLYPSGEWEGAEREAQPHPSIQDAVIVNLFGEELEIYKSKKDAIRGHKRYVELLKNGELECHLILF